MKIVFLLNVLLNLTVVQAKHKKIHYHGITEEDQIVKTQIDFTDPLYSYALDRINQKRKILDGNYYTGEFTGKKIDVYVIDTGIKTNDFFNFTCGFNFIDGKSDDCSTTNIHATHVGSLISSKMFGVAPEVMLINLKVLNDRGSGFTSDVIKALDWVFVNGKTPGVINMSIGGGKSEIMNLKIKELNEKGFKIVVAAGNSNKDSCLFSPSSSPFAITVGAVDKKNKKAKFSNYGSCVNIKAPGVSVIGAVGKGKYQKLSGTSMSSPLVAGAVALKLQQLTARIKIKQKRGILFLGN